ncbi:MAG: hypothetical protein ABII82_16300 [Verrucomicrobiota bacterium]
MTAPNLRLALAAALLLPAGVFGQGSPFDPAPSAAAPATPAPAPAPAAPTSIAPAAPSSLESNTLLQVIDRAFDVESDSINPEEGTMVWKGKTYNIGQFRAQRVFTKGSVWRLRRRRRGGRGFRPWRRGSRWWCGGVGCANA